jgi:hypothetical protein
VIHFGIDHPGLLWRTPPSSDEPIRCQDNHDVYACSHGGIAMLGSDEMISSSRVPSARPMSELAVMPYLV